ncbi:MAG: DUF4430 domain-containing protein [Oscillospiraceae bacterium]|nr:DUF4430 domain-containing protein [Oscillospiraceae bacterium]
MRVKTRQISAVIILIIIILIQGCGQSQIEIFYPEDFETPVNPGEYICLSVYGSGGEEIIPEVYVRSNYRNNISVADLSGDILRELGKPIVFSGIGDMIYVKGIDNLFEFDHGALSGWMYFVNGERRGIGCGSYILSGGDCVVWRYTFDLGEDIDAAVE